MISGDGTRSSTFRSQHFGLVECLQDGVTYGYPDARLEEAAGDGFGPARWDFDFRGRVAHHVVSEPE